MTSGIPMIDQGGNGDNRPIMDFGLPDQFSFSRHQYWRNHLNLFPKQTWPAAIHWIAPPINEQ